MRDLRVRVVDDPKPSLIGALAELEAKAFGDGGLNRWHLPVFARHGRIYILEGDTGPVGAASLLRGWRDDYAFLFDLVVAKAWRGQGHGRRLLTYVIDELRREGFTKLLLTVADNNEQASRLYGGLGFVPEAFYPHEYGKGHDRWLLGLKL